MLCYDRAGREALHALQFVCNVYVCATDMEFTKRKERRRGKFSRTHKDKIHVETQTIQLKSKSAQRSHDVPVCLMVCRCPSRSRLVLLRSASGG